MKATNGDSFHERKSSMAWVYLTAAGLLEVFWAVSLKYTEGWSRLVPSAVTAAAIIIDMILLSLAVRIIPVGTAYAVWTGIGAVGTAVVGIILFGESSEVNRIVSIGLIVAGIIGLKVLSA